MNDETKEPTPIDQLKPGDICEVLYEEPVNAEYVRTGDQVKLHDDFTLHNRCMYNFRHTKEGDPILAREAWNASKNVQLRKLTQEEIDQLETTTP